MVKEITIPYSVTKIEDSAFRQCLLLEKIHFESYVDYLGWGLLNGCNENLVVECLEHSTLEDYCKSNNIKYLLLDSA